MDSQCNYDILPKNIAYNVCFTCLQCTLELKALSLVGVLEHFSYETNFKNGFLSALRPGVRNSQNYFLAQSLFETKLSRCVKHGTGWLNQWNVRGVHWKKQSEMSDNKSFCILCHKAGNGVDTFVCSACTTPFTQLGRVT